MRRADVAAALVWLAAGVGVASAGWELELGSLQDPGSGFLLFWVGVLTSVLALAVLVGAVRAPAGAPAPPVGGRRRLKVVLVVGALFAYGWALPSLGFVVATTLLLVFLFKAVEPQPWWVAVGGAVASTLVAWVVFHVWLGAQLP